MAKENKKSKKPMKKSVKITLIVILSLICAVIAAGGIYCGVNHITPKQFVQSWFATDEEKLTGIWESVDAPGVSAYVFREDGTFDSYMSTVNFTGKYTLKGNRLTLVNPLSKNTVIYKYEVNNTQLTLTLIEVKDKKEVETNVTTYNKVEELNQKDLNDIIGELKSDSSESTTQAQ